MISYGKLRIHLSSPILFPTTRPWSGVTLDGLLGWMWARDRGLFKCPAENSPEQILFPELPLVQLSPMLYGASTMFLPTPMELHGNTHLVGCRMEVINKMANWDRPFQSQIRRGMKDIRNFTDKKGSGMLRADLVRYWSLSTPFVTFYFATEDFEALAGYFNRIPTDCFGIGAKPRVGYGRIVKVEFKEIPEEKCFHFQKDGVPTRPIPVDGPFHGKFPDDTIGIGTWRPPYFSPISRTLCYIPHASQYLPQIPAVDRELEYIFRAASKEQQEMAKKFAPKKKGRGKKNVA